VPDILIRRDDKFETIAGRYDDVRDAIADARDLIRAGAAQCVAVLEERALWDERLLGEVHVDRRGRPRFYPIGD
jgi:hypothetical protein